MSNRRKASQREGEIAVRTISLRRWQIRIRSEQPHLITDSEILDRADVRDVLERAMVTVARTSHMVSGPNREVWWAVDLWDTNRQAWQNICQGKSRLKNRPLGSTSPLLG